MEYPNYNGVEYKLNNKAIPIEVKCPLIDNWINLVDCMENRGTADEYIPDRFKKKKTGLIFVTHVLFVDIDIAQQREKFSECMKSHLHRTL